MMIQPASQSLDSHRWQQLWQFAIETAGSSKAVAAACGVHQSTVTRAGNNPKANLVEGGAAILGWSIADIYEYCQQTGTNEGDATKTFGELNDMADQANVAGDYRRMVEIGHTMIERAGEDDRLLARAWSRVSSGLDGLGFCEQSEKAARRGLEHIRRSGEQSRDVRLRLLNNIATGLYHQGFYLDARMYAREVLNSFEQNEPTNFSARRSYAFVHLLLGHIDRACIDSAIDEEAERLARLAGESLTIAREFYLKLAKEDSAYAAMARLAENGLLEVHVELGELPVSDVIDHVESHKVDARDAIVAYRADETGPIGIMLEAYAWEALITAGMAGRYLPARHGQQRIEKLLARATEIGWELDSWTILRRVAEIKFANNDDAAILDENDRAIVIGLISRFPNFREFGFGLLQNARHVTACRSRRAS